MKTLLLCAILLDLSTAAAQERTAIEGVVPRRTLRMEDLGRVEPGLKLDDIRMVLRRTDAQSADLERLLAGLQDSASPLYHLWLTPEQYADRFGVARQEIDRISAWLTSQGFTIAYTARGRDWIAFAGTAGQIETAFGAPVHRYRGNGETHVSIAADPLVPRELAPLVAGFAGLDDFRPRPLARLKPRYTASGGHYLAPGDIATIYDLTRLYQAGTDGTGQKIVVVGQSSFALSDIQSFRSLTGLSAPNIQTIQTGGDPGVDSAAMQEADLDLEWAGAVARNAAFIYVYSTSADYAAAYAIDQNLAPVVSESYGLCESDSGTGAAAAYRSSAQKANTIGITWVASSGDSGAAACDDATAISAQLGLAVALPAGVPEVTAVGGTQFSDSTGNYWSATNGPNDGSALSYIPEVAWNESALGNGLLSTGGGLSAFFSKPSWQTGPGVPADGRRDVPDVAMDAGAYNDPYEVISGGQNYVDGGTSVAAQVFAGLLALLNQQQSAGGQGNINVNLYRLAQSAPRIFHDIVSGNNMVPCAQGSPGCVNGTLGYSAGAGYDLVTGLGSVDGYNLVTGWATAPPTTVAVSGLSPASATAGGAAFTLLVNGSGFASGATVLWNGAALSTAFVSSSQLGAQVSPSLIATAGTASVTVSSGGQTSGAATFTIDAASVPATFGNQRVTTQAPPASGCSLPAAVTSFTTADAEAYLYFNATVGAGDLISADWLAPDGSTVENGNWPQQAGAFCFKGASLTLSGLTGAKLGNWQARVSDNGTALFTVPFSVSAADSAAAPAIASVANAASYVSTAVSPGEIVVLKGTGLGPATLVQNSLGAGAQILATQVAGTTVTFNDVAAPLLYSSATQIAAIVPYEVADAANVQVVVTYQSTSSAAFTIPVAASVPGVFTANSSGTGAIAALNQDGGLNTAAAPSTPGSTVVIYATGEGLLSPAGVDGKIATAPYPQPVLPVLVTIGGVAATVSYAGSAPGEVEGLMQVNAVVPPGIYGAAVPVVVQVGAAHSQPGATIAVVAPNAVFNVTSRITAGTVAENAAGGLQCRAPTLKTAFLTTDPAVWVWFTFNGGQTGDTLAYRWINPSGGTDPNQPAQTISANGSGCAAASLPVAGRQEAGEPGNWQVEVLHNGTPQFTLTFTIAPPVSAFSTTAQETAGSVPGNANGIPSSCAQPAAKPSFLTTDTAVWVWFQFGGGQTGDSFSFAWIHPSGVVDAYQPAAILTFAGGGCFAWSLPIAGQSIPREAGTWQVRVARNGTQLFTLPFTISAPAQFTVTSDVTTASPTSANGSISCATPRVKTSFLTTDTSVSVFLAFGGAQTGDLVSSDWIHPSGLTDADKPSTAISSPGSGCTALSFGIAGQEAAMEPGVWHVQVFRNGALLFALPFTIASPGGFVITGDETAAGVSVSRDGNLVCSAPASKTSFLSTDTQVAVYFTFSNAAIGDVFSYSWIHPSGRVDTEADMPLSFAGSGCGEWPLAIAGQEAASEPGAWQVEVLRNGTAVFILPFTIKD